MRFKYIDIVLFILLFVFITAFPVDLIPVDPIWRSVIEIGLSIIVLTYLCYVINRKGAKVFGVSNLRNLLFCIPFILASCSNLLSALIDGGKLAVTVDPLFFVLASIHTLLVCINEEIIFRFFVQNSLIGANSFKRIFASAAIFSLMHLLNLVNVSTVNSLVNVLIQVVYTFGLGILLGIIMEYSYSLIGCIILHFSFNFLNTNVYIYLGFYSSTLSYFLTAAVIALLLAAYIFVMYKVYFKKMTTYFRG